jgi:hypothetical protein
MASVFSYYTASFHYSSDLHAQLTPSARASLCLHSPHYIPESSSTIELICLLIGAIVQSRIRNSSHLFMEPRRMTSTCPRGNQGGFYDILQQVATGSSHAGIRVERHGLSRAE